MWAPLVALVLVITAFPSLAWAQDASVPDADVPDADVPDAEFPDAACNDVDALGHCQGDILRVCTGGRLVETVCSVRFGPGFTCRLTEGLGAAQCVINEADAGAELDAGHVGDAGVAVNPPRDDGSSCVKLTPGNAGFISSVGFLMLGRRRRRG